ncbi:MAG: HNH endonuclease [Phycisphaerae bacterium]
MVTAHIARWADEPAARGDTHNVICMCRIHDALFENAYFSMTDKLDIIHKATHFEPIATILNRFTRFHSPKQSPPAADFLRKHRRRCGFEP